MRLAIVINPTSGRRRGRQLGEHARDRLTMLGHDVTIVCAVDACLTRAGLAAAIEHGVDTVLAVGGDGLVHTILDLVAVPGLTLGLVPAGTGNDAARSLGIPTRDVDAALDVVLAGSTRTIDLAEVIGDDGSSQLVATVVASGFDSQVNERANAMTWPRGNLRYLRAIAAELVSFSPLDFTLRLDGEEVLRRRAMLVAVGNGPSFGGGLRICEGAELEDGLLDVVVINPVSTLTFIRVFPRLRRGTHTELPQFERHRVRSVRVESAGVVSYGDGERIGDLPRTVRVLPGALTVHVPSGSRP